MPRDDESRPTVGDNPRWNRPTNAASAAEPAVDAAGAPDERYEVGAEIGRGGMGRVVAATDTVLQREVAIKQALTDDARLLMRFEREARITARLGHPAIVPVFDLGRDATGRPYYVMRRIEGEPLGTLVTAAAGVRERLALLPNALAAIDAAAFAHARRVLHRDIKPWNILVGAYGETLLIDWGLARELDEADTEIPASRPSGPQLTRAGHAYGTPGFMPPEQARGEPVDARADVYALGATLFHLVTGELPHGSGDQTAWLAHVAAGGAIDLARIPDEVSPELVAIIAKAMAAHRAARYADAGELAADLRRFLAGQLVAAHRYTTRERFARLVRRHKVAASAIALAVAAVAAIGVFAIVNVLHERDRADAARRDAEAGQALALERGDQLLVDRAAAFADRDPTRAAALLATLPASSPAWPVARDVLAVAAAHGIAHGAHEHAGPIAALVLAPDGRRALTSSEDGEIHVRDLVSRAGRVVVPRVPGEFPRAIWIDDRTIAVASTAGVAVVDADTGSARVLEPAARTATMWMAGDRLRYLDDATHQLVERAVAGGARRVLAEHVTDVHAAGDVALISADGRLAVLAGDRLIPLAAAPAFGLDRAASADRVAAVIAGDIVEWSAATGAVVRRIPATPGQEVRQLYYGHAGLLAVRSDGRRRELQAVDRGAYVLDGTWTLLWHAASASGDVFAGDDGTLAVVGAGHVQRIAVGRTGLRDVVASADGARIAVGSVDGTLLWWNLAALLPREIPTDSAVSPCALDGGRVIATRATELVAVDLASGARTRLTAQLATACSPFVVGGRVVTYEGPRVTGLVDLRTGHFVPLAAEGVLADPRADTLYTWDGAAIVERPHGGAPIERLRPPPGGMLWFSAVAGRIAVQYADHTIAVREPTGAEATLALPGAVDALGIDGTGATWFARDGALWRWRGGPAVRIADLPAPIVFMRALHAGGATLALRDGSLWYATGAAGPGSMLARQPPGPVRVARLDDRVAILQEPLAVTVIFVASGQRIVYPGASVNAAVALSADETQLAIATPTRPAYVVVHTDPVPVDPAAARAWLAGATNATQSPGTDAVAWK